MYTRETFLWALTTDLDYLSWCHQWAYHHYITSYTSILFFCFVHFSWVLIGKAASEPASRVPPALRPFLGTRQWGQNALIKGTSDPRGTQTKYLTYQSPPYYPFSYDNFISIFFDRPFKLSNPEEHPQRIVCCLEKNYPVLLRARLLPRREWATCKHVPLCGPTEQTAHHIIHECPNIQPPENKITNLTNPGAVSWLQHRNQPEIAASYTSNSEILLHIM